MKVRLQPIWLIAILLLFSRGAAAQVASYTNVTTAMLENPDPADWLSFSRTLDAQRFSPLDEINRSNVGGLRVAWSRGLGTGTQESIPIVHDGIMYLIQPGSNILALDATTGDLVWEYEREYANPNLGNTRSKTIAIYEDVVITTTPDSYVVGLDARTGEVRWESQADARGHSSGPIIADGKVISGGTCTGGLRENCYIAAHDALTGRLLWKFYTAQAPDDPPGFDTWGGAPVETRRASTWGMAGSYDPEKNLIYWGIANPTPNTRMARHDGDFDAISLSAPADLYSNSTVALDPDTGRLVWYYQHLPGDDWDQDLTNERILFSTPVNPDPEHVRWINPNIEPGEVRDVVTAIGEPGGLWVLDRDTGEFLWATPFPYDTENFVIKDIDVETGNVYPDFDLGFRDPGEQHIICFYNTTSYWPSAYHPPTNTLWVPYVDNCLDMTSAGPDGRERRVPYPHSPTPEEYAGIARIDMETGKIRHVYKGRAPGNGAMLATAGDIVFWGDLDRRFRAFDVESGEILWESIVDGPITNSTISYAVDGKQYVAVFVGQGLMTAALIDIAEITAPQGNNSVVVFALPD